MIHIVLWLSLIFQLATALFALRYVKGEKNAGLLLVVTAFFLMAVRRGISLYHVYTGPEGLSGDIWVEYVALAISVLLFTGFMLHGRCTEKTVKSEETLARLNRSLRLVTGCNKLLVRASEQQELLTGICRIIRELGGYEFAWIGFVEQDEARTLKAVAQCGSDDSFLDEPVKFLCADEKHAKGATCEAIRTGRAVVSRDAKEIALCLPGCGNKSCCGFVCSTALPLTLEKQVFGALTIYSKKSDAFDAEEVRLLSGLADDMAYGIMVLKTRTEKELAEGELRTMLGRLEAITQNTPLVAIQGFDREGKITHWNNTSTDLYGFTGEQAIGRYIGDLLLSGRQLEIFQADLERVWTSEKATEPREWSVSTSDGGGRWVYSTMIPVVRQEQVVEVLCMDVDISERKKAEHNLQRMMEIARAENSELETILQTMNHDLRTPLVTVGGFAGELTDICRNLNVSMEDSNFEAAKMCDYVRDECWPRVTEAVDLINVSAEKMNSLLDGFARLARVGLSETLHNRINMNVLIRDVLKTFAYKVQKLHVEFKVGDLPDCFGDQAQITQLFSNLISNAIKYLAPGRAGIITISGFVEDSDVYYCVSDNGIGIAAENIEHIFAPFYRAAPRGTEGHGLGLSIVRRIAHRHNGEVRVESVFGSGSVFYVTLPLVSQ